jgi:hypothetical protein
VLTAALAIGDEMRIAGVLASAAALTALSFTSPATSAEFLFNNLSATSDGTQLATLVVPGLLGSGPLYDSFSTGSSSFFFSSVSLLLKAGNPADGGQYGLALFTDDAGSPGALIDPSNIKFDSDLSTSLEVVTFFPRILLAPNTRYWFGVEASPGASTAWSYSSDLSGVGVASESWADTDAEGPTNVFSNATGHGPFQLAIASPEPATWAMMLVGFGGLGLAAFHRRRKTVAAR